MATDYFMPNYNQLLKDEGEFSNNKNDSGGATRWGVTEKVARAHGYTGRMEDLPLETAKVIYKEQYWDINKLDDIAALSPEIASKIFNAGVNCGVTRPIKWLQRALNVLNGRGEFFSDISADGVSGKMTVFALSSFLKKRGTMGVTVLMRLLNDQQGVYYVECAEGNDKNEDFVFGWVANRVA
jgi:lysozyme family protein